jgi:hypothetical protein
MQRAVYFQTWLAHRPNTHPVHPMKNQGMIEDLERNHATMLAWSMMGGGAVSLPFLESQIYSPVMPQARFHGYMNEKEFNEECLRRGITPYAVIYQAQNWEFPARFNEDKSEILEINILRREGDHDWYGLREFTQDTYPKLFPKKFADYFPGGLVNSDGEKVTDLWQECAARTIYGEVSHSWWVEVEGYTQTCHGTCRNNPVWRRYLEKQIEIVIDAGAVAVQLDETENPLTTIAYGGCFCKDCMKLFRGWLKRRRDEGNLCKELAEMDLDAFDYGAYLRDRHIRWPERLKDIPFAREYWEFQVETENKYFREIVRYVRDYGKKKRGIDVKVSANFFNLHMLYRPSLDTVDLCVTENRRTILRRHEWYRMAAGYTGGKELILTESPYDGFIQKFVEHIHKGKGDDYYRLFVMEAASHGIGMCYPYGAWMGRYARDAFYAPRETAEEVQTFLYDNEQYFGKKSGYNVLVLYDYRSNLFRDWQSGQGELLSIGDTEDLLSYTISCDDRAAWVPYFEIGKKLIDRRIPFDVAVLGDGGLTADTLGPEDFAPYDLIVSADCGFLTKNQAALLREAAGKKKLFIFGAYAENLPGEADAAAKAGAVLRPCGAQPRESAREFCRDIDGAYAGLRVLDWDNGDIYVQQNIAASSTVLHVFNYDFDRETHRANEGKVTITLRHKPPELVRALTLDGSPAGLEYAPAANGNLVVRLSRLPCYTMVIIR